MQEISPRNVVAKYVSIFDATPHAVKCENNVAAMLSKLHDSHILDAAINENRADSPRWACCCSRTMMSFREIGHKYHTAYIAYFILRAHSAHN